MSQDRPPIPRHEPETIAAAARRRHGDAEKVATTAVKNVELDGVALCSRYDKAAEYEAMIAMVEMVPPDLRTKIMTIFCDSKAEACYSVELHPCSRRDAEIIAHALGVGAKGHNGIYVSGAAGGEITLYPGWEG
jgi:hypothetical protein